MEQQVEYDEKRQEEPKVAVAAPVDAQDSMERVDDADDGRESKDEDPFNDTDIAEEASKDTPSVAASLSELDRLRSLVFASRGSKASLPPGWDDSEGAVVEEEKEEKEVGEEIVAASKVEQSEDKEEEAPRIPMDAATSSSDGIAQKMLQRAIDLVGQLRSDSDTDSDSDSSDSDASSSSAASTSSSPSKKSTSKRESPQKKRAAAAAAAARAAVGSDDDDEDGGGKVGTMGPVTKNEVLEPTVDAPPYSVVPAEAEIRPLGRIHSIVDCVVVVAQDVGKAPGSSNNNNTQPAATDPSLAYNHHHHRPVPAPVDMHGRKGEEEGEYSVLDTGSLLAFPDRNVLGVVFETFGSVLSPLYALRYTSAAHVNKDLIQIGKPVCYVPSNSTYVLTRALRALGKGSDASNLYDEEIGDEEQEFSDDEAEAAFKRNAKAARGGAKVNNKKRTNGEEQIGRQSSSISAAGGTLPQKIVRHGLPARPSALSKDVPLHRDAASNQQSHQLSYYDEEPVSAAPSSSTANPYYYQHQQQPHQQAPHHQQQQPLQQAPQHPSAPPPQSAYAQWLHLQQQQAQHLPHFHQQQPAQVAYPIQQQAGYNAYYPSHSHASSQAPASNNAATGSYDPQQPHFNLPPQRPPHWQ